MKANNLKFVINNTLASKQSVSKLKEELQLDTPIDQLIDLILQFTLKNIKDYKEEEIREYAKYLYDPSMPVDTKKVTAAKDSLLAFYRANMDNFVRLIYDRVA